MISGTYNYTPVLRRPDYLRNSAPSRLFNHSYPLKSTPRSGSQLNYSYPNRYFLPPPQIQPPILHPPMPPNYFHVNSYPVYNLPVQMSCRTSISSKGLETILIAILILVALDLVVIRPLR
jgi:hypothetical protein